MSQRPPQLSVVVPTYNRAWCLAEALDSVLAQDVAGVELIVVDDGSTDGTPQLLAGYGDALRVLRRENRGVSAARNAGIAAAQGGAPRLSRLRRRLAAGQAAAHRSISSPRTRRPSSARPRSCG